MKVFLNNAGNGDCILIQTDSTNILVDGRTAASFRSWHKNIQNIKKLDAVFITHIDDDHVNGIIKFIEENDTSKDIVNIGNVFFNGAKQILGLGIPGTPYLSFFLGIPRCNCFS
ncbi:MAG: MBL fold metallo-hydrolase [Deltaproteobacteria bacterium]|nr:MBL fold metallo-hydrolase [Deltaproteobacteria bacterium]